MSKAVLLSIKPKYCELIANVKKTVEVRKTRPKLNTPFKCYIYETQALYKPNGCKHLFPGNGKVIGEFICDRIIDIDCDSVAPFDKALDLYIDKQCCLTRDEFFAYTQGRCAFGFHISYLIIYDKPYELDEFMVYGKSMCNKRNCKTCLYMGIDGICDIDDIGQPLFKPPRR